MDTWMNYKRKFHVDIFDPNRILGITLQWVVQLNTRVTVNIIYFAYILLKNTFY